MTDDLRIPGVCELREQYLAGETTPKDIVQRVYYHVTTDDSNAWIATRDKADVLAEVDELADRSIEQTPLYGIPFAIKDNIDDAGLPTSAGCPAYTYHPETSAPVVETLRSAGGLLIGKTNMDQFATGLVGTRSPYGICRNVFNPEFISGGSSSGSALAVANRQVSFALGTDTAGSGRVPAALNGLVGLKPTRGVLSNTGVVPGCESLSCVSVLAHTVEDARRVEQLAAGYDPDDPYSRRAETLFDGSVDPPKSLTVAVPTVGARQFFGNREAEQLFASVVEDCASAFGAVEQIEFSIFEEASDLLYNGPWVAERLTTVGEFIKKHPDDIDLTVRGIIRDGQMYSASDAFEAFHRLEELRTKTGEIFETIDALVVPTIGTIYTIEGEQLHPLEINSELGYYTNFVNLLDLCAVSVPTARYEAGPTFSVSVIGPAFEDLQLTHIAEQLHTTRFHH